MKVLVCGGRKYQNQVLVFKTLDDIYNETEITQIIQGGARGADFLAKLWAAHHSIPMVEYPADWLAFGPSAGLRRNQQMLEEGNPDLVVAFPGMRGTQDMIDRAKKAGKDVREIS